MRTLAISSKVLALLALAASTPPQSPPQHLAAAPLDPTRPNVTLQPAPESHLREQFIWTAADAAALNPTLQAKVRGQDDKIALHFFRTTFRLEAPPPHATLYLAGPRSATVFLNGAQVLHFTDNGKREKGFNVDTADVAGHLRPGLNTLAIEEVRGHSSLHTGASPTINQVTYGEVLLLKIVPALLGVDAPPLVSSDRSWRSTLHPAEAWSTPTFDDATWPAVQTLGIPGTRSDFLQWNADAGLYAWPGYTGISAAMRTFRLPAVAVSNVSTPTRIPHPDTVTQDGTLSIQPAGPNDPATLTLDFGRELSGRIHLISASDTPLQVDTSYGESLEEALAHPYLGVRRLNLPPRGELFGPKSAFRFVRLSFPSGPSIWKRIDVEGITYPVPYLGAFQSSDFLLNRIWETGAYTAHLCMQEGVWDGPKRDRGRWMGDLDVTGRVISSVFANRDLIEDTMTQVIGDSPVTRDVNTIAGYSALWITGQADFYRHLGDLAYLKSMHERLLDLLQLMDAELSDAGLFTNPAKHKVFVDWSTGLSADTPEARAATHLEFVAAYRQAVYLLDELGDTPHAQTYRRALDRLQQAAQTSLLDPQTETFGTRWQTNAMAVVSGAATPPEQAAIWTHVLTHVAEPTSTDVVTPYYGFYILSAMAALNHRAEALAWMRSYWGGMLAEGATSFWEAYDPHWPKQDFHAFLEADNKKGYYISLAHGWASGPTAWLQQQILGIEPTGRGFAQVTVRPDLAGLTWARGAEPTPRGLLRVDLTPDKVELTLPPGTLATISLPFSPTAGTILDNGRPISAVPAEAGTRALLTTSTPGAHVYQLRRSPQP